VVSVPSTPEVLVEFAAGLPFGLDPFQYEAVAALERSERAPRLTQAANNPDGTSVTSLAAEGAGIDGGAASAEEASVHLDPE